VYSNAASNDLRPYCRLLEVELDIFVTKIVIVFIILYLFRDLQDVFMDYLHAFLQVICKIIDVVAYSGGAEGDRVPNPELTGKLFETISYMLR